MLVTAPVVLLTYASVGHFPILYRRSGLLHFGVFVAFATIYPNVQFFFGIPCKWIAYAFVAISALQCFAFRMVNDGLILFWTVAVAYYSARYASMGSEAFGVFGNLRERFPRRAMAAAVMAW